MPYKLRNNRRHKFAKTSYKITNWPEYNKALQERGSVTLWLSDDVIKAWYETKNKKSRQQGRQFKYSNTAIQAAHMIKMLFRLPYRALTGFLKSIMLLMDAPLDVPDYTRICRRAHELELSKFKETPKGEHVNIVVDSTGLKIFGQGEWSEEKHGKRNMSEWRKLHLVIDRDSQEIIAQELTDNITSDESQFKPLVDEIDGDIDSVSADGGYDSCNVYQAIEDRAPNAVVAIPPNARAATSTESTAARKHNIAFINEYGGQRWQDYSDYNYRALVETVMHRYKKIIGNTMFSRKFGMQKIEARTACHVLNKMASLGMPASVKIKNAA